MKKIILILFAMVLTASYYLKKENVSKKDSPKSTVVAAADGPT